MTDLPTHAEIHEEGPREGFQIEPGPISTPDKIRLIEVPIGATPAPWKFVQLPRVRPRSN